MSVSVKADGTDLLASAEKLNATPEQIKKLLIDSVNSVARATFESSKDKMVSQVNLPRSYIDSKMKLDLASDKPTAIITGTGRGVLLAKFDAKQVVKVASSRAKGSSKLGIPKGHRADGVKVRVKALGSGGKLDHGFFMRLKNGNGMGLFTRDRLGKVRVRYGPSVDQIFTGISKVMDGDVSAQLEREILNGLDAL